jgi:hypothetical protein
LSLLVILVTDELEVDGGSKEELPSSVGGGGSKTPQVLFSTGTSELMRFRPEVNGNT